MFKEIFPDSNIAKNYHSARMKTTCILNGAIAPHVKQTLVEQLKSIVFSMSTDGSNDKDLDKINPITVFYINTSTAIEHIIQCFIHSATFNNSFTCRCKDFMIQLVRFTELLPSMLWHNFHLITKFWRILALLILRNRESTNSQWSSSFYNDSQVI
jgi:hypothetical protein